MEGTVVGGKYTVTKRLDSGGAAETWEASDSAGSLVVLKVFKGLDEPWVAALQSNASAAATVTHPNIARVLDWGTEADGFWIAREFIAGTDLESLVGSRGAVPAPKAAQFGAEVAGALSALHGHGLVHGNVKPANLILTPEGQIKLVGIGTGGAGAALLEPTLPASAVAFVSPEQVQGGNPTPASDIYGLGATLYALATGKRPFIGADAGSVGSAVTSLNPTPPSQVTPGVPAALEAIVIRAMQKDPSLRYGSAEEMRADLQKIGGQTTVMPIVPTTPAGPVDAKKPIWPWIVGVVVLLALIAAAAWYFLAGGGAKITVPDVRGFNTAQATSALTVAGLEIGTIGNTPQVDPKYPAGSIASQEPTAGAAVAKGTKINVLLNGPAMVKVPDVTGQTEAQAIQALQAAGLNNSVKQAFDAKVPTGNVISQTPASGTEAPKGSTVALSISKGQQQIVVPNVVGKSQADATDAIQGAGLKVTVKTQSSGSVPSGQVIDQNPDGGVTVVPNTTVTIIVSSGVGQVKVPNLNGMTQAEAGNTLGGLGLQVQVSSSSPPTGTVTSQDPSSGIMVDPGSPVTITLGGS